MTLSVCLIVKDEEEVIGRCLNCAIKFADEIIVVDTGSTDNTVQEAKKYTDEIYFYKWNDDFSAARNYAFEKASCDFLMWLDADDVISDENIEKILKLKERNDFDMAYLKYAVSFDGDMPTFVYYRERIMRRSLNYKFEGYVHEAVVPRGRVIRSDAAIYHKKLKNGGPLRNLIMLQKRIARGISLDERSKFYYGRELFFNRMYRECIAVFEDFLCGNGWYENKIEACLDMYHAYIALNDEKSAFDCLFKSFLFAPPKSEACCILGEKFFNENDVNSAIYWYQSALNCKDEEETGGFCNIDFRGFIPYIQLCVLYDKLGDFKRANEYNELAGKIKPQNESYLYNREYFSKIIKSKEINYDK